jgi:hypothetical protein
MVSSCARFMVAALLATLGATARAVPMNGALTASTDDTGGRSVGADFSISPGEHVTLSAGAGYSAGSDETADLEGTLLNAGLSLHGGRGGFSLSAESFDDSSNYQSRTLGARGWLSAGDFEIALLGRRRELSVELTLDLPLRTVRREVDFSALGGGLELQFARGNFSGYVSGVVYDYDDDFDRFIDLANSPELVLRPRIEALVGTFLTQAQGAIDRQYGAGVERAFGRHSLALDLAGVHDAILDAGSVSVSLTWRYARSARLDWSVTGGLVDSDTYGDIGFVSVGLGISN